MKLTWLHVSDFHIRAGDPYDRDVVLGALVRSVKDMRERQGRAPDLIFATGDIAQSGKTNEYAGATIFFDELLAAAGLERRDLFLIPGNHDVDREQGIGLARTLNSGEDADKYFNPAVAKPHISQKLGAFCAWYDEYFKGIREFPRATTCGPVEVRDIRGIRLGVLPLNIALFCQDDNDHNKLLLGRRCLQPAIDELKQQNIQLKLALIHHPLDWLCDIERANIKASLHSEMDLILRGHLHETDLETVCSASGTVLNLAAGATYQTRKWPNRALFATYEEGELRIVPLRYEDSPTEVWVVDPSVFPNDPGYERTFAIGATTTSGASTPSSITNAPSPPDLPRFRSNIAARGTRPFIGRELLLKDIETTLGDPSAEAILVLHGPPGVGKSELASEFARRQHGRYTGGTFFIRTGAGANLVDLPRIGANVLELRFPADLSLEDQAERTMLALGTTPTLLIYDNVLDPDAIRPWLPRSGMSCHVLITSLNERLSDDWSGLSVPPLSSTVAFELVERIAGQVVAARLGHAIVQQADGLPIQIVPASRALAYEARRGRLDNVVPVRSQDTDISFHQVYNTLDGSTRLLLHTAAFLNSQHIVRTELLHHLQADYASNEVEFDRNLDVCLDLHLLDGTDDLRMHQLFANFLLDLPTDDTLKPRLMPVRVKQRERFVALAQVLSDNPVDRETASNLLAYPLTPHAWRQSADVDFPVKAGETVGQALYEIGKFDEARPWYERAVSEKEQGDVHGRVDHESLGISLHQVGYCLSSVGKFDEARPWYERAVSEKEQGDVHGRVDHESLGSSLHQVGYCLSSVGKFDEARPWYERAVSEAEQGDVHGRVDHASLGSSLHQVGACLSSVGKFDEARPWYERAVSEKEQGDVHGRVDHASLGSSLHQVGYCLSSVGKFDEARPWYERAVSEKEQGDVHGRVDHASLGRSLHQVGLCLSSVGKFDEARPWYERAVSEKEQGDVHGRVDHESLGISVKALVQLLQKLGRQAEAQEWESRFQI